MVRLNPPLSLSNVTVFSATLARERVRLAMLSRSRFSPGRILLTCRSSMMVGCRRTAELPAPVTCDSFSRSPVSTTGSARAAGSATASPVSMETELVPLPGSTALMLETLLIPLLDDGLVLGTGILCKGERLRRDSREETPPPAATLRERPRDRVLLPRDSFPGAGAGDPDWGDARGQSRETVTSSRPCSTSAL